ncbi:MAG: ribokinase [Rhodospirillales bacterium]|nr:ribokinase [Rhodospirillales bacterium]
MQSRVVVFGSLNLDLIIHVAHLPAAGETVGGGNFLIAPGGKGGNQALAAVRAGAETALIGAVGEDAFAAQALKALCEAGTDLSQLHRLSAPTGTAVIMVGAGGENIIATAPGANHALTPAVLGPLAFHPGEVVLSQLEMAIATTDAVLRSAKEQGARVVLNLAPFDPEALPLLAHCDLLIVNEVEGRALAGAGGIAAAEPQALCAGLSDRHGLDLVVTLGDKGLAARIGSEDHRLPAPAITPVDTVGAGDTFCGYLAAGLAEKGYLTPDRLAMAAAAAALSCTYEGAQPAIPTGERVRAFMKKPPHEKAPS